jgi:uncharacterized protein (TIGR02271 family)
MAQNGTIVGYFATRTKAESAVNALKDAGFTRNHIGLAISSGNIAGTGTSQSGTASARDEHETGTWEKIKDFFTGGKPVEPYAGEASKNRLDNREIAPESYGHEDVDQSLTGMSVTDEQARYFRHRFGSGSEGAIVTVTAPGREMEAKRILEQHGADVGASAAGYNYEQAEALPAQRGEQQNIQLYGEVLRVHKDRVNRGEARLRKEVHTTTQSVEVPVTREELVVERVPGTGQQVAGTAPTFQEQEVRIPLSEERASVEKQPVVREEVRVGKKPVTDAETLREQVRSEELKVEQDVPAKQRKPA